MRRLACMLLSPLPPALLVTGWLQPPAEVSYGEHRPVVMATLLTDQRWPGSMSTDANVRQEEAPERQRTIAAQSSIAVVGGEKADETVESSDLAQTRQVTDDVNGYLPASQLTERPQSLHGIAPDWTEPGRIPPLISGVLLINEYGDVDRVLLDEHGLTPVQQQLLRERFGRARFVPGKLYGRPVRTALRIEVRFD